MRSTFAGLNTMVRGIFANQLSLDTVGHNITNASTEGYSRQSVNLAPTRAQNINSLYGEVMVGTGVDSMSIQRARDVFADKSYWQETATQNYYKTAQKNYDKIEAIFKDTDSTGMKNTIAEFYKAWDDLSTHASTDTNRVSVVEKSNVLADKIKTSAQQIQDQIIGQYDDMRSTVKTLNDYTDQMVALNKSIMAAEATGASANDLRDQRDLIVDKMSEIVNLNVYEDDKGMYSVVSNGLSLVNGVSRLTLEMSDPVANKKYGINDYSINIKEAGIAYIPTNGSLKGQMDAIQVNKDYMDKLANTAAFLLTTFNQAHQQGAGIDGTDSSFGKDDGTTNYKGPSYGHNFWGDDNTYYTYDAKTGSVTAKNYTLGSVTRDVDYTTYTKADGTKVNTPRVKIAGKQASEDTLQGIQIINKLAVNTIITAPGGTSKIAARSLSVNQDTDANGALKDTYTVKPNGSGDGENATNVKGLINLDSTNSLTLVTAGIQVDGKDLVTISTQDGSVTVPDRSISDTSINDYYSSMIQKLGSDSESVDDMESAQGDLVNQIVAWRNSTQGVDWNEELTNMIQFQKGYSASSRCLTTMDEMLDRLINSTGTVGR